VLSIATASKSSPQVCSVCGLYHGVGVACPVASALPVRDAGRLLSRGDLLAGRFRIGSVIHHSTMSTIYRALDLSQQFGVVAIKQVSVAGMPPAEQAEARGWLAREAGLLSSLNDSHLPKLISAFSEGDLHYVVMPYLAGESLKERVRSSGPLPEEDAVALARDMTDALAYLHGQDPPIVHRDLKPDNVLNSPDGHELLLDFGVARPLRRGQVGTAIGTPGYAAPEQYQGFADERSDLYALGATLHYMLTGYDAELEPPFQPQWVSSPGFPWECTGSRSALWDSFASYPACPRASCSCAPPVPWNYRQARDGRRRSRALAESRQSLGSSPDG